ncbi:MAG TPA: glycosyltransferase family 39 protein [Chitinophagaceae bacterium]|nr:glycosyltransferase family 39 protein [Chitinophagaceae bacterium]
MTETQPQKSLFPLLLAAWTFLNLLQAIFTEVHTDEAVYFTWAQRLDWGFFDHPPFVAFLIWLGSAFLEQEAGVRLMTVLLQPATLWLVWHTLDQRKYENRSVVLFFVIAGSMVMFTAYGFITTPDVPLLFFTALFLFAYKKFLNRESFLAVTLLAVSMAGLVYSKYHGVLVIGFVIFSNLRLLLNGRFWVAGIAGMLLCAPHFGWLVKNDFPSFQYQFAAFHFNWKHFLEYIPNQLVAFNPATAILLIIALLRKKPAHLFERGLYFVALGVLLFFWALAFKGHVQAQWTVAASIPAILLLHNRAMQRREIAKAVRTFVAPTLLILLAARVALVTDLLPRSLGLNGKAMQYLQLSKRAQTKPVVFTRAYQQAALYHFFTGKPATSISSLAIRKSQYDIWRLDRDWARDSVYIVLQSATSNIYRPGPDEIREFIADHLQTPNDLEIRYEFHQPALQTGDSVSLDFSIRNRGPLSVNFKDSLYGIRVRPVFRDAQGYVFSAEAQQRDSIAILEPEGIHASRLSFRVPELPRGTYRFGLSCMSLFGPAANSLFIRVRVR